MSRPRPNKPWFTVPVRFHNCQAVSNLWRLIQASRQTEPRDFSVQSSPPAPRNRHNYTCKDRHIQLKRCSAALSTTERTGGRLPTRILFQLPSEQPDLPTTARFWLRFKGGNSTVDLHLDETNPCNSVATSDRAQPLTTARFKKAQKGYPQPRAAPAMHGAKKAPPPKDGQRCSCAPSRT